MPPPESSAFESLEDFSPNESELDEEMLKDPFYKRARLHVETLVNLMRFGDKTLEENARAEGDHHSLLEIRRGLHRYSSNIEPGQPVVMSDYLPEEGVYMTSAEGAELNLSSLKLTLDQVKKILRVV